MGSRDDRRGDRRDGHERKRAALHCAFFLARAIYWSRRGLANVIRPRVAPAPIAVLSSLIGKGKFICATSAQAITALGPRQLAAKIEAPINREEFRLARSALKTRMSTIPRFAE